MKKDRQGIIRLYDTVRIINPLVFLRVGYPLTKQIVKDTLITSGQKDAIRMMIRAFNIGEPLPTTFLGHNCFVDDSIFADNVYTKVLEVMASAVLKNKGWGGKNRQIFTETRPELFGVTAQVLGKKVVKTGVYSPGCSYHDYYNGGTEYEPPTLDKEQTHIILVVYINPVCDNQEIRVKGQEIEIEKCHVIRVRKGHYSIQHEGYDESMQDDISEK